jgi:hypothetical protein
MCSQVRDRIVGSAEKVYRIRGPRGGGGRQLSQPTAMFAGQAVTLELIPIFVCHEPLFVFLCLQDHL